jgi:hypothetical protein
MMAWCGVIDSWLQRDVDSFEHFEQLGRTLVGA